jgi:hypothetical protein
VLGAALAFAALYVEASTFIEDSSGATTTCSWDPDRGALEASLAGPVVGSALVFLGLRRSEPGAVRTVAGVGAVIVILASLLIPAARLLSSLTGTPLC